MPISAEMIEAGAETLLEFKGAQHASEVVIAVYMAMSAVRELQKAKIKDTVH